MAIGAALILGGAAAGGSILNAASGARQNRKSMEFQREMFDKTNAYNSPLEQRKRLQAAGLNPNLVYGGSSGGVAGTASQPAKPDYNVPEYGSAVTEGVKTGLDMYNIESIQAGTDVNKARSLQIKQETVNSGIEAVNKALKASSGAIDLKTKQRLFETNVKTAEENLRNLSVNADFTTAKNSREERITDSTVHRIQTEIDNNKKRGEILTQEAIMKKLDASLYEEWGLRPDDPFYYKIIGRILNGLETDNPLKH